VGRAAHAGLEPENGLSALLVTADILTRLPSGRIDSETTANIGWMEGGLKRNIVPERARLDGEFRSRSNDKLAWLEGQFPRSSTTPPLATPTPESRSRSGTPTRPTTSDRSTRPSPRLPAPLSRRAFPRFWKHRAAAPTPTCS
jgi:tripeptide aminopeptidase